MANCLTFMYGVQVSKKFDTCLILHDFIKIKRKIVLKNVNRWKFAFCRDE